MNTNKEDIRRVVAVSISGDHSFSKQNQQEIILIEGIGVEGDIHSGRFVQHRSRKGEAPKPNLRQVHLIHAELHQELKAAGFQVKPGEIGENITTEGIDLLSLARGTKLHLGSEAVIELTGLRNPCKQLDDFQSGLMSAVLDRGVDGKLIRKSGVMAIVLRGGTVKPGDEIEITSPTGPLRALEPV